MGGEGCRRCVLDMFHKCVLQGYLRDCCVKCKGVLKRGQIYGFWRTRVSNVLSSSSVMLTWIFSIGQCRNTCPFPIRQKAMASHGARYFLLLLKKIK